MEPLNLFYQEPDPDRWLPLDRYPRRVLRRLVRGQPQVGGHGRVFLNLCAGLDQLKIPYRVNNYRYLRQHPQAVACILGKPQVLERWSWPNPILLGPCLFSHPIADPDLFQRLPVKQVLVPGEWNRLMWQPDYGDRVLTWPVGIDTDAWAPDPGDAKDLDFLVYDKVRWDYDHYRQRLIEPILDHLEQQGRKVAVIRYGHYREADFRQLLRRSRAMVFLCEHETQGIAYQQALACGVPILAWDRGGDWQDPAYFPDRVRFGPVSSVPYWDQRCGVKFQNLAEFPTQLAAFLWGLKQGRFSPRDYILENLTLAACARRYVEIVWAIALEVSGASVGADLTPQPPSLQGKGGPEWELKGGGRSFLLLPSPRWGGAGGGVRQVMRSPTGSCPITDNPDGFGFSDRALGSNDRPSGFSDRALRSNF